MSSENKEPLILPQVVPFVTAIHELSVELQSLAERLKRKYPSPIKTLKKGVSVEMVDLQDVDELQKCLNYWVDLAQRHYTPEGTLKLLEAMMKMATLTSGDHDGKRPC